jgi:hypothetical protein
MEIQTVVLLALTGFYGFTSWLMWKWSVDNPCTKPYSTGVMWYSILITALSLLSAIVLHRVDYDYGNMERIAVHLFPAVGFITELFLCFFGLTNLARIHRGRK